MVDVLLKSCYISTHNETFLCFSPANTFQDRKGHAMSNQKETITANAQKRGFWAFLKESIAKSNEGCGPGCGCHAADDKGAKGGKAGGDVKKHEA